MDGILHTAAQLPGKLANAVVSRIKIMANLDIAEHRLPQDGRDRFTTDEAVVDLRISVLPSQFGEKVVIRLLTKDLSLLDLENLQMPPTVREGVDECVASPQGLFLVTGPTGSGKSTTLYAMINAIDREHLNVVTLEDPIEYSVAGITQVQVKEKIGMTFASGLRSFLRQDPDVILVGEIRDLETVEIACRAAMTGHKVLSTIHTNDTCQAITRLLDMGTPPYLITATLRGVVGQRLVRVICEHCRQSYTPNETELALLGHPKVEKLQRGSGCEKCASLGYKGRMAIFEYFKLEDNMHRLVIDRASAYAIRHAARRNGMIFMDELAKRAVINGKTTVSEVQRVILSNMDQEQLCTNCQRVISIEFMVCPFCQHALHEACPGCGHPLDSSWEACPVCGHEIEREWQKVFCRKCLAPVDPGWTSCQYCGSEL